MPSDLWVHRHLEVGPGTCVSLIASRYAALVEQRAGWPTVSRFLHGSSMHVLSGNKMPKNYCQRGVGRGQCKDLKPEQLWPHSLSQIIIG